MKQVFFSNFEKLIIELKNADAQVTEKDKLNYLLRTLPSSLSYIGDFVDVLSEEDRTADFVKDKIKMHEVRNKEENQTEKNRSASSNAFNSEKKKEKKSRATGAVRKGTYNINVIAELRVSREREEARADHGINIRKRITRPTTLKEPEAQSTEEEAVEAQVREAKAAGINSEMQCIQMRGNTMIVMHSVQL